MGDFCKKFQLCRKYLLSSHSCFLFHFIRVEYGDGLALNPDGALLFEFGEAAEERELLDAEDICHFLSADIQMDGSALLFGSYLDEVLRHLLLDGEKGEHAHFLREEDIYP